MIRLLLAVALILYGLYAGFEYYQRSRVLGEVRAAVEAQGEYDQDAVDRHLARLRRQGEPAAEALESLVRDKKLELVERQMARRALQAFEEEVKHRALRETAGRAALLADDLEVPTEDVGEEMLARFLESGDPAYRIAGARALGGRGEGVPADLRERLRGLLDADPYLPVRAAAARALGALGVRDAVGALAEQAREHPGPLGRACVEALADLGGAEARGALEDLLDEHPEHAARGLEALADPRSAPALAPLLSHQELAVRLAAGRALVALRDPRGTEALLEEMRSGLVDARAQAIRAAAGLEDAALVEQLVAGTTNPDPALRIASAEALAAVPGEQATAALKALMTDSEQDVRVATMRAIGGRDDPALGSFVRGHLRDKDDRVREAAIFAAVARRDANVVDTLREIFHARTLQPDYVRRAAWLGLKELTGKAPELAGEEKGLLTPRRRDGES